MAHHLNILHCAASVLLTVVNKLHLPCLGFGHQEQDELSRGPRVAVLFYCESQCDGVVSDTEDQYSVMWKKINEDPDMYLKIKGMTASAVFAHSEVFRPHDL
jgi:hypothetical protein